MRQFWRCPHDGFYLLHTRSPHSVLKNRMRAENGSALISSHLSDFLLSAASSKGSLPTTLLLSLTALCTYPSAQLSWPAQTSFNYLLSFAQREGRLMKSGAAVSQCSLSIYQRAQHSKYSLSCCSMSEDWPGHRWGQRSWIVHIKCPILAQACIILDYHFQPNLIGSSVIINFGTILQDQLSLGIVLAILILSYFRMS